MFHKSELYYIKSAVNNYLSFQASAMINWLARGHAVRNREIREYFLTHPVRRVHLGATYQVDGFLNSQIFGDIPIDITRRLPFPDESVDLIYSSHLVEHIHLSQFHSFLKECLRVLKKGGQNIIATPSLKKYVDILYGENEGQKALLKDRYQKYFPEGFYTACQQVNLSMRCFGHRFLYDFEYMSRIGPKLGYGSVCEIESADVPDENLRNYIKADKPQRWFLETSTYVFRK